MARRNITIVNGVSNTAQIDNLVPGVYYVYEYLAGNPSGMALTTANGVQVTVTADDTATIPVVEFTNDKTAVGSIKITKNVTINGEDPTDAEDSTAADGTYTFYVVDDSNNEVARRNITIVNGESSTAQIDNLVPGTYYVYEYVTSNPSEVTLVTTNGVEVTVTANNTSSIPTAEFTNDVDQVGSLRITKNVTINGEDPADAEDPTAADGTYTFYVVDESNNEVARRNITIVNGESKTEQIDNLVPGVYYVYEYLATNPTDVTLVTANGVQVTVTADDTAEIPTAEFTNDVEDVGSLKITKNVTINSMDPSEAEDPTAADGTYTFYVVDESNNEVARRTITIVNGESKTEQIDNLVPGVYYVYEYLTSNPSGVTLATANGVQVTVTADDTAEIPTVEFTNDVEDVGSLKITKNVTINGEDPSEAEDATAADGTYTFYVVDKDNNEVARRNITIVNGESKTEQIDNLIPGTYYVYEYLASNPSGVTLVTTNGVEVKVTADDTAEIPTAEFTNDVEDVGSLKITKNVTINGEDPADTDNPTAADGSYTFLVEDEDGNEAARRTITIVNGESKTEQIDNLIPGKYIVKEVTSSLPDDITLISTNSVEVTVTADDTATIPTAVFTNNKYEAEFTLTATKKLTGRTLESGQFGFSITEVADATASAAAVANGFSGTATNDLNGTISFPAVTYTTSGTYYYKIAETVPADADKAAGYTYDTSYYIVTVTVTNDADNDGNADTTLTAAITAVAHYDEKGDVIDDVNASNLAESVVLTNKYAATGTLTLTAMKSLLASTASGVTLQANQFEFQVSGGKMASGSSVTAKNDADGKVDFGTVDTYDETDIGKTYTYDVSEVIPDPKEEGYTYDTVVYTVTVEVVDNGNGTLTADIKSIKASNNGYVQEMEFENLYTDGSEIFLKAYKTLEGRTMTDGQFSFTAVEVTDETGTTEMKTTDASGASANTYKSTVKNQAGEVIFDEISYEAGDVGDHYYKISEVIPSPIPDGYRYDTSYYIVTVNVTDKTATGGTATELSTSVTAVVHYDGNGNDLNDVSVSDLADAATFTNVYEASGDLSLEVTKTLNADETTMSLTDGQFTFKITEVDQYGTAVAGGYTETKTNDADGKVTFEKADAYDESDAGKTYYYQIEEVVTDSVNGFTYDTKVYTAAVTISDNGDGTLSTDITYTYSDGTDVNVDAGSIAFTNSYETKGEITFTAAKTLNYRTLPNNLFTFNLVQVDSNGDEVTGGFSSSAKNDANGNVTFETISYTTSGTYYYKVSESIGTLSYYDYDKTVYMVTVEVTDNGEGVLTAVVTKVTKTDANNTTTEVDLEGATPTTYSFGFENTYLASGTLDLEAAKILTTTETPLEAGQFTFEVSSARLTDSVTAANDAKGKATFTGVDSYDQTDIGKTYTYTVKEIIPSDAINNVKDGITYDTTEYTVYVKVVDQGRGKLGTEITYEIAATQTAADAMTFSNIYTAEGQIYLKATKKLTNSTLTDDEFTFTAVEVDANGDEVSGGYSETAKNKAGTATFPVVTYEKSGTYYYKIAETNGGATYYTYDDSYYIVKVTVKDNSTGVLNPEITDVTHYDSQGNLIDDVDKTGTLEDVVVFTNNYIAKGSLSVEATKVLTSDEPTMVLTAGAFTFKITQVEADGSVTAGGYSEMKTNDADGKVTFAKTDLYDQTDIGKTYYYTVEEVIPDPQVNGYTYDSKIYTVAVAISDNGDGTLKTELTYTYSDGTVTDAQAKSILFTNTYATAGSITLSATKTLTGRTLTANQFSFTITEVDAAGTAVANGFTGGAANNAAGAVTFPAISYTKSGTYYYQIEEVNDGQSGYSYDSSVYTVTVTVTDDGEGSLTAEVTGVSKDGSAITNGTAADVVFANTYAAAGSLTLKATKSMARTDSALGTFEFVLTDVTGVTDGTGTVLQTVTNDTTGAITFAALNYTLDDAGKTYTYTVSEKTQTGTGYFFDETIYTVTVTAADNGDGTLKLTTTVTDGTGAEMTYTDTVMTFTNDVTSVKIRKIDVTTEEELPGATIRIVDENGTVIDEWVSTTEDHEVTGLIPGKTYTLRETVAPTGYDITTDTTFVLNTDGTIDTSKTTTTVKDGVLLVEDSMTVSATATISVTKNLTYQNEAIDAVDQIFYVGLYVDAACTNLYASKAIAFKNASSATVTFDGLEIGRTYYIAECDSTGAALASGVGTLADGTIFAADFGNGATTATATVTDGSQTTITFANEFYTMPGGFYKEGTLTITKKLLDPDGDALNSSEVFYAGIFADSSYTTLATNVSENIVTLDLAGSSSVSVEVGVSIGTGETVTLYVTEVDADGNPVADAADFAYEVSVDTTKVTLDETTTTATVTITNQEIEEVEEESEYEEETETETETETTAVQTGDDTPLTQYIVILILALAIILMAVIYRRREREIKN
ncbi:MAG: hypothetical protein LUG99_23180 [Lachnospiraceae bacterium]|nr:hypothetical protein [Lachnospiraceae bacterium]